MSQINISTGKLVLHGWWVNLTVMCLWIYYIFRNVRSMWFRYFTMTFHCWLAVTWRAGALAQWSARIYWGSEESSVGELQVFLDLEKKNPSVMLLLRIELEFLQLSEQSYRWLHRTCSWLCIFPCWSLAFSLFLVIYLFSEFIAALFELLSRKMFNGDSRTPLGLLDWRVLEWFGFDKHCFDWWLRPLISYQVRDLQVVRLQNFISLMICWDSCGQQ